MLQNFFIVFYYKYIILLQITLNKKRKRLLSYIIVFLFILWICSSLFLYFSWFNFELFFKNLHLNIYYEIIIILLIYTFRNYLLIPSTLVILFSWFLFQNFLLGLIINIIWVSIWIIQTYFVGYILRDNFNNNRLFDKISKYKDKIKENWFKVIFIWAFFPIITVDIIYYSAWLIKYNFTKCFIAWFSWQLPLIILYSYLWKEASRCSQYLWNIAVWILLMIFLYYYIKKIITEKKYRWI